MEFWESIPEQKKAKEILNILFQNRRVPHAFIFSGPDGVGKFNTALQFCKILYSTSEKDIFDNAIKKINSLQEPVIKYICPLPRGKGEEAEYSSFEKLTSEQLELYQSELQKKINNPYYKMEIENANTIKISSIRDIKKFMSTTYDEYPFQFIIVDNADLMNEQSQNALLKSLEEPPEGYFFFLLTSKKEMLLPTIISRCWNIDFDPLSNETIKNILINYFNIEPVIAEKASIFSEGSIHTALFLINHDISRILKNVISILRYSFGRRFYSAYKELYDCINSQSDDELKLIIRLIKIWLNDILKKRYSISKYYFDEFKDTIEKFNDKYGDSRVDVLFMKLSNLEEKCDMNLNLNVLILNLIFELRGLTLRN